MRGRERKIKELKTFERNGMVRKLKGTCVHRVCLFQSEELFRETSQSDRDIYFSLMYDCCV